MDALTPLETGLFLASIFAAFLLPTFYCAWRSWKLSEEHTLKIESLERTHVRYVNRLVMAAQAMETTARRMTQASSVLSKEANKEEAGQVQAYLDQVMKGRR